jgi:hypothetical protein
MNPILGAAIVLATIFGIAQCDERKDPKPVATVTAPATKAECVQRGGRMQTFWYGKFGGTRCVDYK